MLKRPSLGVRTLIDVSRGRQSNIIIGTKGATIVKCHGPEEVIPAKHIR